MVGIVQLVNVTVGADMIHMLLVVEVCLVAVQRAAGAGQYSCIGPSGIKLAPLGSVAVHMQLDIAGD